MIEAGRGTPIRQALEIISAVVSEITGVSAPVIPVAPSDAMYAIESRVAVIDAGRFKSLTGWNPMITLEMEIRAMVHDLTVNS